MPGNDSFTVLDKLLDFHALRHKVMANNIANAEVPNFQPKKVEFSTELAEAITNNNTSAIRHSTIAASPVSTDLSQVSAAVDVEQEMGQLMKNKAFFDTFSEVLSFKLRMLRSALGR